MKNCLVIGLGNFGKSLALELALNNIDVMVIDNDPQKVEDIKDKVTSAICIDATDEGAMANLPYQSIDIGIVAIGEDEKANIWATSILIENGIPSVYVKANSLKHGRILEKLGANYVIYPESIAAKSIADSIVNENIEQSIDILEQYKIFIIKTPDFALGHKIKNIKEFNSELIKIVGVIRKKLKINNYGNEYYQSEFVFVQDEFVLTESDSIILIADELELKKILNRVEL